MPTKAKTHRPSGHRTYDQQRGSAAARGYGYRWRIYRRWFLRRNPLCSCGQAATDVDHIKAVSGPDDPLFWEPSNHQPLCHPCHSAKTRRENGPASRVGG
jgi:5-methylcytosine-specific restriction protein A